MADILTFNGLFHPFQRRLHLPRQWHVSNGYLVLRGSHKDPRTHQVQGHLTFTFPIAAAADEQSVSEEDCP